MSELAGTPLSFEKWAEVGGERSGVWSRDHPEYRKCLNPSESLFLGVFGTSRQVSAVLGVSRDLEVTEHAVMVAPRRFGKRTVCLSVFWSILSMSS